MFTITECPVCKSSNFKPYLNCKDYTVSQQTFQLIECINCNLKLTNPRPDDNDLGQYYKSENYISHTKKSNSIIDKIYRIARVYTLKWKLKIVLTFCEQSQLTILDYGCGTGDFLQTITNNSHKAIGYEPSPEASEIAKEKTPDVFINFEEISETFDAITLWHVLEHVPDLNSTLQKLGSKLKKNGTMFIAVPNPSSHDADKYKNYWAGYDVPRHLWHFPPSAMQRILDNNGLKLIKTIPMKLDAYYISMMSEKYQTNASPLLSLIKGLFTGFDANLKSKADNNYSSLIYIARKK